MSCCDIYHEISSWNSQHNVQSPMLFQLNHVNSFLYWQAMCPLFEGSVVGITWTFQEWWSGVEEWPEMEKMGFFPMFLQAMNFYLGCMDMATETATDMMQILKYYIEYTCPTCLWQLSERLWCCLTWTRLPDGSVYATHSSYLQKESCVKEKEETMRILREWRW